MLFNNPELRRNFWLELTPVRLVIAPLITVCIVLTPLLFKDSVFNRFDGGRIDTLMLAFMAGLLLVYGCKKSTDAVIDELNDGTWVLQRMTPLSSSAMITGKLFGANLFAWYGTVVAFTVGLFFTLANNSTANYVKTGLLLAIGALGLHAILLNLSLFLIRGHLGNTKVRSTGLFVLGLMLAAQIATFGFKAPTLTINLTWYGISVSGYTAILVTALYAAFWGIAGFYQTMRAELLFRNKIYVWVLFLLSLALYGWGFREHNPGSNEQTYPGFTAGAFCVLTYATLLFENKSPLEVRSIITKLKRGNGEWLYETPLWFITLLLSLPVLLISSLLFVAPADSDAGLRTLLLNISVWFCMVRDMALVIFLFQLLNRKQAALVSVLVLGVLYAMPVASPLGAYVNPSALRPDNNLWILYLLEAVVAIGLLLTKRKSLLLRPSGQA